MQCSRGKKGDNSYHADFLLVIEILVLGKTNPNGIKYGKLHLSMKRRSLKSEQLEKANNVE